MRPALPIAVLSTVHAGGEQGWELDHLEPFSFLGCVDDRFLRNIAIRWPGLV
jgi:hypothetical protein